MQYYFYNRKNFFISCNIYASQKIPFFMICVIELLCIKGQGLVKIVI